MKQDQRLNIEFVKLVQMRAIGNQVHPSSYSGHFNNYFGTQLCNVDLKFLASKHVILVSNIYLSLILKALLSIYTSTATQNCG
jgi:hypothetical protein